MKTCEVHKLQSTIALNMVNSFPAAWMQITADNGGFGMYLVIIADLPDGIAARYDAPPQILGVIVHVNHEGKPSVAIDADRERVELRGLCLANGMCRYSGASCYAGLCFDN